jgi:hypothetical protein
VVEARMLARATLAVLWLLKEIWSVLYPGESAALNRITPVYILTLQLSRTSSLLKLVSTRYVM